MNKSIFEMAQDRFDGLGLTYNTIPACDIDAQSYSFEDRDEALSAISELNTAIYDWNMDRIRVELVISGNKHYVTVEQLEEEPWYCNIEELAELKSKLEV